MDEVSNIFSSKADPPVKVSDPDDIAVVSSALGGGATIFVTGDKALLELRAIGNMSIVSPRELFERLIAES